MFAREAVSFVEGTGSQSEIENLISLAMLINDSDEELKLESRALKIALDPRLRTRAYMAMSFTYGRMNRLEDCLESLVNAVAEARRSEHKHLLLQALAEECRVRVATDDLLGGLRLADEALYMAVQLGRADVHLKVLESLQDISVKVKENYVTAILLPMTRYVRQGKKLPLLTEAESARLGPVATLLSAAAVSIFDNDGGRELIPKLKSVIESERG